MASTTLFRDLKRFISEEIEQEQGRTSGQFIDSNSNSQLAILKGLPFYRWDLSEEEHKHLTIKTGGLCCFTDAIGRPVKNGVEHPLYDYERDVFETIFKQDGSIKDKHTLILKATGLGISDLALRIVAWLCLKDDQLKGSQICLITGPRIDLSITLVDRLKKLFYAKNLVTSFESKETVVWLNGVKVEAFPSHHLSAMRGLTNVSMIIADEAAYFPQNDQIELRDTIERYIGKSSAYLCLISTPNRPGDFMNQLESEPEDTCIYRRLRLGYEVGLNKIYSFSEIEKAKASPSFSREFDLRYAGIIGNVFSQQSIEEAITKGKLYNPDAPVSPMSSKSLGLDPAWGSSAFGIVLTEFVDGIVRILYADEFHRADYANMLRRVYELMSKYEVDKVYCDGANPSFIRSLKLEIGEDPDYDEVIARYKAEGLGDATRTMKIVPVNFKSEHRAMLAHTKLVLEDSGGRLAINPKFEKLLTSLRTAVDNEGVLDKELTSYNDLLDGLRLSLKYYQFS